MKWAEALVAAHLEPQPLSHSLDGEGSEVLNVESVHKGSNRFTFQEVSERKNKTLKTYKTFFKRTRITLIYRILFRILLKILVRISSRRRSF